MQEITLDAIMDNIPVLTDYVNELLEQQDCPMKIQVQIDIVIDEIVSNIARYAYPDEPGPLTMKIDFLTDPKRLQMIVIDEGPAYNPLEKEDPDVTLSAEERGIGGLGIFIVKKSMDEVDYSYENGKNVLCMTKLL